MKSKHFRAIFFTSFFFILSLPVRAETIYMTDGTVIKAKIIERGSYYIITEKNNVPMKYFNAQIERIDEDGPESVDDISGQADPSTYNKNELILKLIDISGVRASMIDNVENVIVQAPMEQQEGLRGIFVVDDIIARLIPVYDKYYTDEELLDVIRFYESPAGQKVIEVTPKIMQETIDVSIQHIQDKLAP